MARNVVPAASAVTRTPGAAPSPTTPLSRAARSGATRLVGRNSTLAPPSVDRPLAARRPTSPEVPAARPVLRSGWVLLATVVGLLVVIGLMMVLSASSVEALRSYGGAWVFFRKQAIWVAVGIAALVGTTCVDYRRWRRVAGPAVVASAFLLLAVLVPGVGIRVSGSTRWLGWGWLTIQPSELAKLALLVFVADLLSRRADRMHDSRVTLRPVLAIGGALTGLVLLQPDMGTAMVMVLIVMVLLFVGEMPLIRMATMGAIAGASAFVLAMGAGYRRNRMVSFMDPWADASHTGYQVAQSLVALGTGNLAGVGLGASRAKWGFLPNAHTDFIFAIVGEELGLLGTLLVVGLFVAFTVLGIRVALRAPDRFGTLLAAGVTAWIGGQAVVNIGAVTGVLPVTGIPLPFVSFGGSAMVVSLAAVGVLLNVARRSDVGVPARPRPDGGRRPA